MNEDLTFRASRSSSTTHTCVGPMQYVLQWIPADVKMKLTFKRCDKDVSAVVNRSSWPGRFTRIAGCN